MKIKELLSISLLALGLAHAPSGRADDKIWSVTTGDFLTAGNWQGGLPGAADTAVIDNDGTATIPNTAGAFELFTIRLGTEGGSSGHIVMEGGTLTLAKETGGSKPIIGNGTVESSFIMNGGTIFLDAPDTGAQGTSFHGASELDWEVGEKGLGHFEMHGNSQFFASDDLKGSDSGGGTSVIVIDGNSRLAVGSGVSLSGGANSKSTMTIGGNALVEAGNSMGAGNPAGGTDEGYLTMASGQQTASGTLTIQNQGIFNFRRLSAREGTSTILVKDHGQMHIFDVLTGAGTNQASRPAVTGPNSTLGSTDGTNSLTLQDDAQMTVNSDPESGPVKGLAISGPRDAGNPGGKATFTIRDRASFRVEQDLGIGNGTNPDLSDGTLEIIGPDASVSVGGNLNLAVNTDGEIAAADADGNPKAGKATLSEVITGSKQATVNVQGIARMANGRLKVKLNGFTPVAGNSFTLIKGGTINGTFAATDFSEAALGGDLSWKVEYTADSVLLNVVSAPGLPKKPEENGLTPKTSTIFVNTGDQINNGSTESLGVTIAKNGNVLVGWEDDGDEIMDLEAVWTMYSPTGESITPPTQINSTVFTGGPITSKFLSYFRQDGTPTPGASSWGPKIKANLFGDGIGMGATSFALGDEVPELAPIQNNAAGENAGDFPSVQLLSNTGQAVRIVSGVDDAYAEREGDIRVADWDYLSNGNILVVGESRQRDDLVNIYGGETPQTHAIYRIVGPNGNEVKAVAIVSSDVNVQSEIWHGSAATANGFSVRMGIGGRGVIRLFNNDGTPASTNIDLGARTGFEINAAGGRGDGVGFHGNGKDAYVLAVGGTQDGAPAIWVSVLNADGSLRYSKSAAADVAILSPGRVDAAIDDTGRVLVVFDAQLPLDDGSGTITNPRIVMGRVFDAAGTPLGGTFYVSEKELPVAGTPASNGPRASLRDGNAAVTWESLSAGTEKGTVALRIFAVGGGSSGAGATLTIAAAGANSLQLSWTGGTGPFLVQRKSSVGDAQWMNVLTTSETTAVVPNDGTTGFFRVMNSATNTVAPLSVVLNGASEKPTAIVTPGIGRGTLSLEGSKLAFDIKYSGLTATANNAHIHGFAGTADPAGVIIGLNPFNGGSFGTVGRIAGSVDLNDEQKTRLLAGDTYVNIHTTINTGGEIRGQVYAANLKATLTGAAERPTPVETTATGSGKFTLVGDELFVDVSYTGLKGNISNAHIHGRATPEAAADVLVDMKSLHVGAFGTTTSGQFLGHVTLTPDQLNAIIDGETYFNIHSAVNTGGEIRGQIVP